MFSYVSKEPNGDVIMHVDKYSDNEGIIPSEAWHRIDSFIGVKATVFNSDFAKKFIDKYTLPAKCAT